MKINCMRITFTALVALLCSPAAHAQNPYAGMESRSIKALSDQQTADLKAGRGMGLALAAELNGYPGPSHVLEAAEHLGLTTGQRHGVENLFNAMKAETVPLGEQLLEREADLDRQFASHAVTPASLKQTTLTIGQTQTRLREAHLKYHLLMTSILTPEQVHRYNVMHGYAGSAGHKERHPH